MGVYINACQSISPQETFLKDALPEKVIEFTSPLKFEKVSFKEYFPALQARRINNLIKSSHVCAVETLNQAGIEKPEAIITASGLGCVASTERFLNDMIKTDEGLLAPTSFIQSTPNAVGAQIALHYKTNGYNVVYAQKSFSFECALHDAVLRISNDEENTILVGGFDEITAENYSLKQKIGLYKNEPYSNLDIASGNTSGSIPGEACTFFLLSGEEQKETIAEVVAIKLAYKKVNEEETVAWVQKFLSDKNLTSESIDVVVKGTNGDEKDNQFYDLICNKCFPQSTQAIYKNLCGEFDTASSFGMWFASNLIKTGVVPAYSLAINKGRTPNNVLLYNQTQGGYHSLILLKSCK